MSQGFTKGVPVDTDINLAADSNLLVPSQHAIKTYVDNNINPGTVTSVQLSGGTGITIGGANPITSTGVITVTNSAPDQTVSLTGGTGISITGTYPSFTVINSSPSSGGTVTSIATSSPITGGTITGSGTIGITQATTSTNGYLSNTDWSTFNSKQEAITLTTTGTSGASTLVGNTLNIPQYNGVINWAVTESLPSIGSTIKADPVNTPISGTTNTTMSPLSQRISLVGVWLPRASTITGIKFIQGAIGNFTASNFNGVGLYTLSAGTFTRVAISANSATTWTSAGVNTLKAIPFTSTYSASAGLYFAAIMYSASATVTSPTLFTIPNTTYLSFTLDNTNGVYLTMFVNSQTTMPATLTIPGGFLQSNIPYLALY